MMVVKESISPSCLLVQQGKEMEQQAAILFTGVMKKERRRAITRFNVEEIMVDGFGSFDLKEQV